MPTLSGPDRPALSFGADSIVIMLHGRGSNGNDLIGLSRVFSDALPTTAFYAPNAPHSFEDAPTGFQWYSTATPESRTQGVRDIASTVNAYIDELLAEQRLAPSRAILLGFSQGCITSLHLGPRRERPLAGVVGLSGAMVTGDTLQAEIANQAPILLVHGEDDTVLPPERSSEAHETLQTVGVPSELHIIPGLPHAIDQRVVDLSIEFIQRVLA